MLCLVSTAQATTSSPQNTEPDVDLRFEFGPTQNQGTIGWCYAYTAADMLTHWLYRHHHTRDFINPENQVSPIDMGISVSMSKAGHGRQFTTLMAVKEAYGAKYDAMTDDKDRKALEDMVRPQIAIPESGHTKNALRAELAGICFQSDVPSSVMVGKYEFPGGEIIRDHVMKYYMTAGHSFRRENIYLARTLFPRLSMADIEKYMLGADEWNPLLRLAEQSCRRLHLPTDPQIVFNDIKVQNDRRAIWQGINTALDAHEPAEITIKESFLTHDPEAVGKLKVHSVLVVGRQQNKKTHDIDYILRNSHGVGACEADRINYLRYSKRVPFTCEGDFYVVPLRSLISAPYEATYLN